ncbi:DEAD/DEAH box helicase, partial [Jiangella ureilytica]|uniref:DEAD/DEAH box helicase n=1 Tax=Jiangella ureilytica TaxID=2530374 RepID=UPI00193C8DBD
MPRPNDLLDVLLTGPHRTGRVTHIESIPARAAKSGAWPLWVDPVVRDRFMTAGIVSPWAHQAQAASLAWSGRHVVIATGTASGKSLAYHLPALTAARPGRRLGGTTLYLSPTKALAADQLRSLDELGVPGVMATTYDGDTPVELRDVARAHATYLLTNPDMLHHAMLPAHHRWAGFLRSLRFVVVDECHTYRGVFGSHVAHVLRRLRRVCAIYGSTPTFVLASATTADPGHSAERLIGMLPIEVVTEDGSPSGAKTFLLWEPPLIGDNGLMVAAASAGHAAGSAENSPGPDGDASEPDGSPTGDGGDSAPGDGDGSAPGNRGGSAPGNRGGSAPGVQVGSAPGVQVGSAPGDGDGSAPGNRGGSASGVDGGPTGAEVGSAPGDGGGGAPGD